MARRRQPALGSPAAADRFRAAARAANKRVTWNPGRAFGAGLPNVLGNNTIAAPPPPPDAAPPATAPLRKHLDPFLTPDQQQYYNDQLDHYDELLGVDLNGDGTIDTVGSAQQGLNSATAQDQYDRANLVTWAKKQTEAVQDDAIARGIFQSSMKDANLNDMVLEQQRQQVFLDQRLHNANLAAQAAIAQANKAKLRLEGWRTSTGADNALKAEADIPPDEAAAPGDTAQPAAPQAQPAQQQLPPTKQPAQPALGFPAAADRFRTSTGASQNSTGGVQAPAKPAAKHAARLTRHQAGQVTINLHMPRPQQPRKPRRPPTAHTGGVSYY